MMSLTVRCLFVAGVYAAFVAGSVWFVAGLSEAHMSEAFVSESDLDAFEDDIFEGDYTELAKSRYDEMEVLVLDEEGEALYASSSSFARAISRDDLAFINEDGWEMRYSVLEEEHDGETMYRVMWIGMDGASGFEHLAGYALLDRNLAIVEGTLFPGRTALTPRQFGLLNGVVEIPGVKVDAIEGEDGYPFNLILRDGQYVISRREGQNSAGEARTVVYAIPVINADDYNRVAAEANNIMLLLIPVVGVATIVLFLVEMRLIRASTQPLSRAIAGYGSTRQVDIDPDHVVSELRPVYDGFMDMMRRLEHAQADRQRMIADISHDIKTPLTVIRGYAQAFRDGMVPPERTAAYAQALCSKAEVATEMVAALSEYAMAEHPEFHCDRVERDLAQVMEGVGGDLAAVADQHGCTFELVVDDAPLDVLVDAGLLRRALTNLVANACVHNDPGTRVGVLVCRSTSSRGTAIARIQVVDDGRGIAPEMVDTLFEPFVTSNTARSLGKGTGLGLAISRRFVELNGGTLRLVKTASAPWTTCFEIELPCR